MQSVFQLETQHKKVELSDLSAEFHITVMSEEVDHNVTCKSYI